MSIRPIKKERGAELVDWKQKQSEGTRQFLEAALNRFESRKLINFPNNQKLTRLSLAKEAGVAEDTPFSRYRPGHPKAGEYRFRDVVRRFEALRKKFSRRDLGPELKKKNAELKTSETQLKNLLEASRRVVNAQDIRNGELELRNQDLEERLSQAIEERDRALKELQSSRPRQLKGVKK
jgi:hypothetical protein